MRLLQTVSLILFSIFFASCGGTSTQPIDGTANPKGITVIGKQSDWTDTKPVSVRIYPSTVILGNGALSEVPPITVGVVSPNGDFSLQLPDGDRIGYFLTTPESAFSKAGCDVDVSPIDARVNLFYIAFTNGNFQTVLIESTKPPTKNITSPASDSQTIVYTYSDKEVAIRGVCDVSKTTTIGGKKILTYELSLKPGWNKVVWYYQYFMNESETKLSTINPLPTTSWYRY
jgi:hypothetical protein